MSDQSDKPVAYCSVFPNIGIARLGESDEYFVGPEAPDHPPDPQGGFKDAAFRIKRQAARFRVYAFDADGNALFELTSRNTRSITWRVSLANKKASWYEFGGSQKALDILEGRPPETPAALRNADWPGDRLELIAKSNAAVQGVNARSAALLGRIYRQADPLYLGELRTDTLGRLMVLGGRGHSQPIIDDDTHLIDHYANNDGWYDDTSDGPVDVDVILKDGQRVPAKGRAWVIVAPPDFSPHTINLVTLFDVIEETALKYDLPWHPSAVKPPKTRTIVDFLTDVYPLLTRIVDYQWVNAKSLRGHGPGKKSNFLTRDVLVVLADPNDVKGSQLRKTILEKVRNPNLSDSSAAAISQANYFFMPQLSGDEGDCSMGNPRTWLKVTSRQYETLTLWAADHFTGFSSVEELQQALERQPANLESLPVALQPFALTRSALTACVGGPFYPGIEMTSTARSKLTFDAAFEITNTLEAGDITKWMALPWQADFYECNTHWWPAQRPDDVVTRYEYDDAVAKFPVEASAQSTALLLFPRVQWDRGVEIGRTLRPVFDWPDVRESETTSQFAVRAKDEYLRFAMTNWSYRGNEWPLLPKPQDGESLGRYQFRLREIFDRYSGKAGTVGEQWRFELPIASETTKPNDYRESVIAAFKVFYTDLVPASAPGQSAFEYRMSLENSHTISGFISSTTQAGYERRQDKLGDNQMVRQWRDFGFVVPVPDVPERILVEVGRNKYDGLKDREYFYMALNMDRYPDFRDKAKKLAYTFLQQAKAIQKTPQFQSEPDQRVYEFFPYSPTAVDSRLAEIYNQLAVEGQQFNPVDDSWRREDVIERLVQVAPFNQLDGAWLRNATNAGPISDVNSLLFEIWSDETGNGDPALNHANLYTALLQSIGIYLPDIRSRAYVDHPRLLDSAFTLPLFQLVISEFSAEFFPEILGMSLQLEWEVLGLWGSVKRLEHNKINAQFYRMHIGIDNADEGHGAKARQAVNQYIDHLRETSGETEALKQWERIWTGYAAFATTGDISNDLAILRNYPITIDQRMVNVVTEKKRYAQLNHGNGSLKPLGENRLNDWFEDPDAFLQQLAHSQFVTPGDPDHSLLLTDRVSYHGPMYKIFTADELKLWADWIRWLGRSTQPETATASDAASLMAQLITKLTSVASRVSAHKSRNLTTSINGAAVTKSVADWFLEGPVRLMTALRDAQNHLIVQGSAATSPLITDILQNAEFMAASLIAVSIEGRNGVEILEKWINSGCPLPSLKEEVAFRSESLSTVALAQPLTLAVRVGRLKKGAQLRSLYRTQLFGNDAVH
jgi:hypothetical protein